jgi:SMC interacting uncharacterized protein involved in chromosome segregation
MKEIKNKLIELVNGIYTEEDLINELQKILNSNCKELEKEFELYKLEKEDELDNLYIELNWYQEHYG